MRVSFTRRGFVGATLVASALPSALRAAPTVFPTGTTIYDPDKAWSGFTVLSTLDTPAVLVIDMNGRTVKRWDGFNVSAGGPARILPGGVLVAPTGAFPRHQEATALVAADFDGRELWRFDRAEEIAIDGQRQWSARQHHDWQPADFPAGYYSPHSRRPRLAARHWCSRTRSHTNPARRRRAARGRPAARDRRRGQGGLGLARGRPYRRASASTRPRARRSPGSARATATTGCTSTRRATSGRTSGTRPATRASTRDNVIVSSRSASVVAIVARDGSIVWRLGPDSSASARIARARPGDRPARRAPDSAGTARRGQPAAVRQRRRLGLGRPEPDLAAGQRDLPARHLARARDRPGQPRARLVLHRAQLLQHQHQRRAAAGQRQHADHRRRAGAGVRGHRRQRRSSGNS